MTGVEGLLSILLPQSASRADLADSGAGVRPQPLSK